MATLQTGAETNKRESDNFGVLPPGAGPSFAPIAVTSIETHVVTPVIREQVTAAPVTTTSLDDIAAAPAIPQQEPVTSYHGAKQQPQWGAAEQPAMVPMVIPLQMLQGELPMWIDCPFCYQRTLTQAKTEGTSMQVLTGVLLCLICIPLACLPCCAGWFEDILYSCSSCKKLVARRFHDGGIEVYGPTILVPSQHPK